MSKRKNISRFFALVLIASFSYMFSVQLLHAFHLDNGDNTELAHRVGSDANATDDADDAQTCKTCQFLFHQQQAPLIPSALAYQIPTVELLATYKACFKANVANGFIAEFTNKGPPYHV